MMTTQEKKIYEGLKSIGSEVAAFFHDAVKIRSEDFAAKPYLLAHLSREIESGLRDILTAEQDTKKEVCESCYQITNRKTGHKESILRSLGLDDQTALAKKWYRTAKEFPKFAHRHGAWKNPREKLAFDNLWEDFLDILDKLVGNYFAIADRLDVIIKLKSPTKQILGTLPNLLQHHSRLSYFFYNLESEKWLVPLHNEGYFDAKNNPSPVVSKFSENQFSVPFWPVLRYLERVGEKNFLRDEAEISKTFASIIDSITSYRTKDGVRIENFRTDHTLFLLICYLPKGYLKKSHLAFVSEILGSSWLRTVGYEFGKLLDRALFEDDPELMTETYRIFFQHTLIAEADYWIVESILGDHCFATVLADRKQALIQKAGLLLLEESMKKAEELIPLDKKLFNNLWLPAIEDHEQTSFPDRIDCQIAYLIRDCLEKLPSETVKEKLILMLDGDTQVFKRIAVHTINIRYKEYRTLFWDWCENPLNEWSLKHEIYELLKNHASKFTSTEIDRVLQWIETGSYFTRDRLDETERSLIIAHRKKEWATALIESGHKSVVTYIRELDRTEEIKVSHPGFHSWHSTIYGDISPLSVQEISQKSLPMLIQYFSDFDTSAKKFGEASLDGLIDTTLTAIHTSHHAFITNCKVVVTAPKVFQYTWIRGISSLWRGENKIFNCTEIFEVINDIVKDAEFWKTHEGADSHCNGFVLTTLAFIEDVVKEDYTALDGRLLDIIREVLLRIYIRDKSEVFFYEDLLTTVLNNSRGRVFLALLEYSFVIKRKCCDNSCEWDTEIKEIFENHIGLKEDNPLLFAVIGHFLPKLTVLDPKWVKESFNRLFPVHHRTNREAAITGYFLNHSHPLREYFPYLLRNDILIDALGSDSLSKDVKRNLIFQICSAYLNEFENCDLSSSIMRYLITNRNRELLKSIVSYFWNPKAPLPEKFHSRVVSLWETIYQVSSRFMDPSLDVETISGCSKWLDKIDKMDEQVFHLMKASAAHILDSDRHFVMQALKRKIDKYPFEVGQILLAICQKGVSYDISRGLIQSMVESLYFTGNYEIANLICLLHAEENYLFLRDSFNRNNPN